MQVSPESDSKGLDAVAHPSSSTFFFMHFHYVLFMHALDCLTCTKTYDLHFLSCGFITCQLYMRQTV